MGKRDYFIILSRLIEACVGEEGITHLMMITGLNYLQIRRYLGEALKRGLITEIRLNDGRKYYRATKKGLRFLDVMTELENLMSTDKVLSPYKVTELASLRFREYGVRIIGVRIFSKKRDRLSLYVCILSKALKPIRITELCNKCLLGWATCSKIVNELLNKGLLSKAASSKGKTMYVISNKGKYFIGKYVEALLLLIH